MSAFDTQLSNRLRNVIETGPLVRSAVGEREREMWFRSQLSVPPRLLPGESADGKPSSRSIRDVLVLNPGESTAAYDEMYELVPFLTHLPHPQAVVTMLLERFSPYFDKPGDFGIRDVRPKPFYKVVFDTDVDPRIAYQFDYDHAMFSKRRPADGH